MNAIIRITAAWLLLFILPFSVVAEQARGSKQKQGAQRGRGGGMMHSPLHKALDINKDGAIDANEIKNASKALSALDRNGDGRLEADELKPSSGGGRQQGEGVPAEQSDVLDNTVQKRGQMGERIKQMDVNGDGILQSSEMPPQMKERMLERLDKNGDGDIDKTELLAAAKSMQSKNKRGGGSENENETGSGVKPKRPGSAE